MAITTKANKYKESSKDSWMTAQTKPVSKNNVISTAGQNMVSKLVMPFGVDAITKNVYTGHFSGGDVITNKAKHMESHTIAKTVA